MSIIFEETSYITADKYYEFLQSEKKIELLTASLLIRINIFMSIYIYIYIYKVVSWPTVVNSDSKVPFSIATTPRCKRRSYVLPWIAPLTLGPYLRMLSVK